MTAVEDAGPRIATAYPGPRARAIIERMRAVEGAGPRTGGPDAPLVVEEASGSTIVDPDGNRFVDLAASFAAATVGHSHPAVVAAIRDQAGRAAHVASSSISEVRDRVRGGAPRDRAGRSRSRPSRAVAARTRTTPR